jgi:fumarate reductase flavoprotein subunit
MRIRVILTAALLAATVGLTGLSAQNQSAPLTTADGKPTLAKKHIDNGLDCAACHGEGKKQPVEADKCLECHESFKAVSERTKDMKPNPHTNHLVESDGVECTQCHHGHKATTVVCLRCHTNASFDRHKQ